MLLKNLVSEIKRPVPCKIRITVILIIELIMKINTVACFLLLLLFLACCCCCCCLCLRVKRVAIVSDQLESDDLLTKVDALAGTCRESGRARMRLLCLLLQTNKQTNKQGDETH